MGQSDDVINYLIQLSGGEIRTLINNFEALLTVCQDEDIDLEKAQSVLLKPVINIDASDDNYFDTLSGLQKSIRGSDVDASLHYLAKLIVADDLQSLSRRLLAIAYEDIGLANRWTASKPRWIRRELGSRRQDFHRLSSSKWLCRQSQWQCTVDAALAI